MINKKEILKVMIDYGKKVGFPEKIGPKEFVQDHLNDCFKLLLSKRLVKPEHYEQYRAAAILAYQKWWLYNR